MRQTKTFSRPGAGVVDGPGDQLLAHPAFAADQHRGVAGGGPGDLLGHLADRRGCGRRSRSARPAARGAATFSLRTWVRFSASSCRRRRFVQGHGHRVGHGQGELQVVGVGHASSGRSSRGGSARRPCRRGGPGRRSRWWRGSRPGCRGCPACCRPSTLRASTASPSRITVEARKFDTRW